MLKVFCPHAVKTGRISIADPEGNCFIRILWHRRRAKERRGCRIFTMLQGVLMHEYNSATWNVFRGCARVCVTKPAKKTRVSWSTSHSLWNTAFGSNNRGSCAPEVCRIYAVSFIHWINTRCKMCFNYVILFFIETQYINKHTAAAILLFCVIFIFSWLWASVIFFPPWIIPHTSLAHRTSSSCSKQVPWLVLLYILWFNKENTNVSQCERSWWYQCHAFHWFLFTWCPREARWLVAFHTWPGNFVHLTGSRRVLWRSEKRQRDKN